MLNYKTILNSTELTSLSGKEASYKTLTFAFSDDYIKKLQDLLGTKNALQIGLYDNKNLVGYIASSETLFKDHLFIHELFVDPTYQNKGIASTLINKVIDYAKGLSLSGIVTQTERENIPARNLYEKIGFEERVNPDWTEGITYFLDF